MYLVINTFVTGEEKRTVLKKRKRLQKNKGNYSHVIVLRVFLPCYMVDVSTSFNTGHINWPCTVNTFHYELVDLRVLQYSNEGLQLRIYSRHTSANSMMIPSLNIHCSLLFWCFLYPLRTLQCLIFFISCIAVFPDFQMFILKHFEIFQ
jgi:hypothetical protein